MRQEMAPEKFHFSSSWTIWPLVAHNLRYDCHFVVVSSILKACKFRWPSFRAFQTARAQPSCGAILVSQKNALDKFENLW